MKLLHQVLAGASLVGLLAGCANNPSFPAGQTTGLTTAARSTSLSPAPPQSLTYLTFPDGSRIPCLYNNLGSVKAVAVAGIHPGAKGSNPKRNAKDLAEEKYISAKVRKGEFLPGIYHGGPITYSTGNGLQIFTP